MKLAAIFCVLATICHFSTNGDVTAEIESMISITTENIKDLNMYGEELNSDLKTKLWSQKYTQFTNFNEYAKTIISDIESAIAAVHKNGKNADLCLLPPRMKLLEMLIQINEEFNVCINIGLSTITEATRIIDHNILLCNNTLQRLESIKIDCLLFGAYACKKCLMEKIPSVYEEFQSLKNIIGNSKSFGAMHSVTALTKAMVCNENLMEKKRYTAEKHREDAMNCIARV